MKLVYEVGESYIPNDGSEYAANCVDLQGIKRYNIFRYFEDVNMLLPVATEFDEENNTLYAETDELGTYCVLDMEILLQNLGIEPDGTQTGTVEAPQFLSGVAGVNSEYNVTFIIDTREGIIADDELKHIKAEISTFLSHAIANGYNVGVTIYTQNSTNLGDECCEYIGYYKTVEDLDAALEDIKLVDRYADEEIIIDPYCEITEGIEKASLGSQGTNDYVFSIFACDDSILQLEKYNQIYKNASSTGVNISFITDSYGLNINETRIADITGGIILNNISMFADDVYNHIFGEPLVEVEKFHAILATGYQEVELVGVLNAYNGYDTDLDGLSDWDEVGVEHWANMGLIKYDEANNIVLPTIMQCMLHLQCPWVEKGVERFSIDKSIEEADYYAAIKALLNTTVMPITSDPTNKDGDGDGYADYTEIVEKGSNALIKDVISITLSPYFNITYTGNEGWKNEGTVFGSGIDTNVSYGGSQNWFWDNADGANIFNSDYNMQESGCGLIAFSDVILYLTLCNEIDYTEATKILKFNSDGTIEYESYLSFVRWMHTFYIGAFMPGIGVLGTQIVNSLNSYSAQLGDIKLNAKWGVEDYEILLSIIKMLNDNIPVILSFGPREFNDESVPAYVNEHGNSIVTLDDLSAIKKTTTKFYGHYVVVTGIISDQLANKILLEISSWGRKYYVFWEDYEDYMVNHALGGSWFSNIVYITKERSNE